MKTKAEKLPYMAQMSDAELLSVFTDKPLDYCQTILAGSGLRTIAKMQFNELLKAGITKSQAVNIKLSMEIGRRAKLEIPQKKKISSSIDSVEYLRQFYPTGLTEEHFYVLFLNRCNVVIKHVLLSTGGTSATIVDAKVLFKLALEHNAAGIILCHNHPSGNIKPSDADRQITKKMHEAGKLLDIVVLDHIILTDYDHYSFADSCGI